MPREEKHGTDAIASGIEGYSGGRHPAQPAGTTASGQTVAGSLAEAIENATPRPVRSARREDTTVDAASLTDADGNPKPTHLHLAAALEAEFRNTEEGNR